VRWPTSRLPRRCRALASWRPPGAASASPWARSSTCRSASCSASAWSPSTPCCSSCCAVAAGAGPRPSRRRGDAEEAVRGRPGDGGSRPLRRSGAAVGAGLATLLTLLCAAPAAAAGEPALHLEAGAVARDQLVALGRDVEVAGEALADVVAIDGT